MKKRIKTNFRVIVYPKTLVPFSSIRISDKEILAVCDQIYDQTKRHVDDVDLVTIDYDEEYVCEHCGNSWTEDSETYNGGCCKQDQEDAENDQRRT